MDEHNDKFNKELENIKKNQTDEKCDNWNKKCTGRINSKLDDTEEQVSKLEDRVVEITQAEQKKEKKS